MDSCHRYLVGSVLLVEIVQIKLVLEVVDVYLSALLNHVVRLYVICELLDIQCHILLCQGVLGRLQATPSFSFLRRRSGTQPLQCQVQCRQLLCQLSHNVLLLVLVTRISYLSSKTTETLYPLSSNLFYFTGLFRHCK